MRGVLVELLDEDRAVTWHLAFSLAAAKAQLTTDLRIAHFLAQVMHETAGLTRLEENLNYSAERLLEVWPSRFTPADARVVAGNPRAIAEAVYFGRLGNTQPGDAYKFRGRGCIMITGKANYQRFALDFDLPKIMVTPDLVAHPPVAALSAAWYWKSRGINVLADADDVTAVTRAVNGGTIGLEDRRVWLERVKAAIMAAGRGPDALGAFYPLVLHGLSWADVRAIVRGVISGAPIRLGRARASITGSKLDIRREDDTL